MMKKSNFRWRVWLGSGLVAPVFLAGCLSQHAGNSCDNNDGTCGKKCLGFPALFSGKSCESNSDCADGSCGKKGLGIKGSFDKCSTIPPGAIPPPIGTHTNEVFNAQAAMAEVDQFVIYLYEWYGDTANFGPFGSRHIERIAARLPKVAHKVILEPDRDPAVNEARRVTVIDYLEKHGNPRAGDSVILGFPQAEGLYGDQAERIYRQMLLPQGGSTNRNNNQNFNNFNSNNVGGAGYGGVGYGGF